MATRVTFPEHALDPQVIELPRAEYPMPDSADLLDTLKRLREENTYGENSITLNQADCDSLLPGGQWTLETGKAIWEANPTNIKQHQMIAVSYPDTVIPDERERDSVSVLLVHLPEECYVVCVTPGYNPNSFLVLSTGSIASELRGYLQTVLKTWLSPDQLQRERFISAPSSWTLAEEPSAFRTTMNLV